MLICICWRLRPQCLPLFLYMYAYTFIYFSFQQTSAVQNKTVSSICFYFQQISLQLFSDKSEIILYLHWHWDNWIYIAHMLVYTCKSSQSLLLVLIYVIAIQSCMHLGISFILKYFRNKSSHNKQSNQMSILLFPSSLAIQSSYQPSNPFLSLQKLYSCTLSSTVKVILDKCIGASCNLRKIYNRLWEVKERWS